jgi:hypothetical protein
MIQWKHDLDQNPCDEQPDRLKPSLRLLLGTSLAVPVPEQRPPTDFLEQAFDKSLLLTQ